MYVMPSSMLMRLGSQSTPQTNAVSLHSGVSCGESLFTERGVHSGGRQFSASHKKGGLEPGGLAVRGGLPFTLYKSQAKWGGRCHDTRRAAVIPPQT